MFAKFIPVLFLPFCLAKSTDVTFKNATFRGYSLFTEKFKKTIPLSNSLKDNLPESAFDKIEFIDQNIPVLYQDSLADLDELDELVLEHCGVYEIQPGALKNVPMLRRLSLKGNKIEAIKEGVFNNLELSTVDLSLNLITTIHSSAFNDLPSLLNINLADNNIQKWNKNWFKNTPLLTRVSMQNNSIAKLPNYAFKNLAGNKSFGKLKLTVNIVLSYNKIRTIEPEAFRGLTEVNHLWLDNNQLQEFGDDLLNGVDVKDLRLNNNNIRCLDGNLARIIKAESTQLDSNPFDCECLSKIKDWAKKNNKNVQLFFSEMDCSAQRIRIKMTALEKRLKEIRDQDNDIEVAEGKPSSNPIK
ncbi:slit homolog 3 protein-like [Anoplophora glabripennis]|uniref:slit homolog 3 protein-like n=1 Tax=Anoplophora glabripennis TaxID=217634 RepID=UPI000873A8A2|nr:slit homolog 3 protein-like [Anoplophora glabripennis]